MCCDDYQNKKEPKLFIPIIICTPAAINENISWREILTSSIASMKYFKTIFFSFFLQKLRKSSVTFKLLLILRMEITLYALSCFLLLSKARIIIPYRLERFIIHTIIHNNSWWAQCQQRDENICVCLAIFDLFNLLVP